MYALKFYIGDDATGINTYTDWHLVPLSRPVVNPPSPKTNIIDIPGANGSIDLTESLNNYVVYNNRSGSWDFMVLNDRVPAITWDNLYSNIMAYLHGQHGKVYLLEDDCWENEQNPLPNEYYYEGRFSVNEWNSGDRYSRVTISYDLAPFQFKKESTTESKIATAGGTNYTLTTGRMPVIPTFTASGNSDPIDIGFKGKHFSLPVGTKTFPDIIFGTNVSGTDIINLKGSGNVSISFRGGKL